MVWKYFFIIKGRALMFFIHNALFALKYAHKK